MSLSTGTKVKIISGDYAGKEGVVAMAYHYLEANTDYDVFIEGVEGENVVDSDFCIEGTVYVEDYELEAI